MLGEGTLVGGGIRVGLTEAGAECGLNESAKGAHEGIVSGLEDCEVEGQVGFDGGRGLSDCSLHLVEGYFDSGRFLWGGTHGCEVGADGFDDLAKLEEIGDGGRQTVSGELPGDDVGVEGVPVVSGADASAGFSADLDESFG